MDPYQRVGQGTVMQFVQSCEGTLSAGAIRGALSAVSTVWAMFGLVVAPGQAVRLQLRGIENR